MKAVFKDNLLNTSFNNEGYLLLKNIIDIDFASSYQFFNNMESNVEGKFYASLWSKDKHYRMQVDAAIKERLLPIAKNYLNHYEPLFADLLVKKPSLTHKFDWHQDWTFVDENHYSSIFIWCPLQDVTARNGCIKILPKSHMYFKKTRGSNIPPQYSHDEISSIAAKYAITLPMKKGDIIIFDQAVFHASPPNRSLQNRLAIGLLCLPKNIDIFHYHFNILNKQIEQYKIDFDFMMRYSESQDFLTNLYTSNLARPNHGVLINEDWKDSYSDIDAITNYKDAILN